MKKPNRTFKKNSRQKWKIFFLMAVILPCLFGNTDLFAQTGNEFAYYRLGVKYKKEKKKDKAIEAFRKVLAVYPDNYNSYYQIAEIRIEQGKLGLAAYELKKALEYKPNWPKAQRMLAKCYEDNKNHEKALIEWRKFTQTSRDSSQNAEAEKHIKRLLAIIKKQNGEKELPETVAPETNKVTKDKNKKTAEDPDYKKGLGFYKKKKYKKAITYFRKTIKRHPGHSGAFYYAGIIRYEQKKYDMAAFNFSKALDFDELGFNSHFYLGLIYENQHKIRQAIKHFRAYIKLTKSIAGKKEAQRHINRLSGKKTSVAKTRVPTPLPSKPFVYRIDELLAFLIEDTTIGDGRIMMDAINLFRKGKYDAAMKKFKTVVLHNPKGVLADDAIYNVGICYMKLKLYKNAQNQFEQVITAYPKSRLVPKAEYLKGVAELEKDEFSNAEKIFRKWIRHYPKNKLLGYAYARLGNALVKQDMIKDGIDAYRAGLPFFKSNKSKIPVLFAIGENYENIDNPSKAASYFEETIKTGKPLGLSRYVHDSYLKLGDYYYKRKNYNKARHYYDVMMGTYPNSTGLAWAKFQTGNIYRHNNVLDSAIYAYKELIQEYPDNYWARQAKWKLDDTIWQNEYKEILQ